LSGVFLNRTSEFRAWPIYGSFAGLQQERTESAPLRMHRHL